MKQIRFIHTADLHLDSPFIGLEQRLPPELFTKIRESTFRSFHRIMEEAIKREVDFVLISGDLFDGEDRSIKAQARLQTEMNRLKQHGISVYLLHGNHDHLSGQWVSLEMPSNVHIFSSQVEMMRHQTKEGAVVHLYGFSYEKRHIWERKINEYHKEEGADFHIGMLHGYEESGKASHQPYASFSVRDLLEKQFDYWALGHIHQTQILHKEPYIVYPGNIQGRNRKETGAKGCYYVEMDPSETRIEFIETADIIWKKDEMKLSEEESFPSFFKRCQQMMEDNRRTKQGVMLEIQLENVSNGEIKNKIASGELLEALQDGEELNESFVWIHQLKVEPQHQKKFNRNHPFYREFELQLESLTEEDWEEALSSLYYHYKTSRFLTSLTEKEKAELLEEGKRFIQEGLAEEGAI
jgi:DNA repair exonuclease SbcCD nuclease subunit